ncbi:lantibiotic dehydratase [Kitasatospora sp. NPDC058444]|uniref:lantibiotic dehydratase n=1 Tax=Kitasatospora sp. NPDC058444 TaxID=3346504 RepID=UPI00364F4F02
MTPDPTPAPAPATDATPAPTHAPAEPGPPHGRPAAPRARHRTRPPLYEPAPWLIVRTPLLPVRGPGAAPAANPRDSLADPRVRRALAIASPDLLDALQRPGAGPRDAARAELKLARYLIRMSTRPTPYGAFAAVSLARWGERTTLRVREDADRIRTRPDMGWLTDLCLALDHDPAARADSLWSAGARTVERHGRLATADGGPAQDTGSVRLTAAVREALRAARRPVPYARLRRHLLEHTAGSPEQIDRLLTGLWQQRLLVTDLRAALTTADPAEELRRRLAERPSCARTAAQLAELLAEMAEFDRAPADQAPRRTGGLTRRATAVHPVTGPAFQSDMARPVDGDRLAAGVGEACAQAAELLLRLSPQPLGSPDLAAHRGAFTQRYGHDREVPLLELLDERSGIGPLGHTHGAGVTLRPEVAARRANTLTELALGALRDHERVVELTDSLLADLQTVESGTAFAPLSLELSAFVAAAGPEAVDRGDFLLVVGPNLGASSAGRSLGRFAGLLAPQGPDALRGLGEAECRARPEAGVPAEVVYLPSDPRMANVLVRPAVHEHEIVLDVPAGVPPEQVVPLDDILVGVRHDRYRLRSRRLDTVLRPTARHMLNTHQAPAVCRFLDEAARDGSPEFTAFDWGPAAGFPFLPRVQYGRIVLCPARWLLRPPADGTGDRDRTDDARAFAAHVTAWRTAWSAPARLYLSMADNRLLLDLDDPAQLEQLRAEARRGRGAPLLLQEALPDTGAAWLPGTGGVFMSELVAPLVLRPRPAPPQPTPAAAAPRKATPPTTPTPPPAPAAPAPTAPALAHSNGRPVPVRDRLRLPGSDWLFAKFYCDRDQEDALLAGPLRHLCEMAEVSGLAQQWFFIRYADPDPHLRLRWKGDHEALTRHLLPEVARLTAQLTDEGLVSRLVIDTYERELERYGGSEGTDASEQAFCADSRAVMRLLAETGPTRTPPAPDTPGTPDAPDTPGTPDTPDTPVDGDLAELAAVSTDDLLAGLGLTTEDRLRWYTDQAEPFQGAARRQAGEDYRVRQRRLRALLGTPRGPDLLGGAVREILAQRRGALAPVVERLSELEAAGRLGTDRARLLGSYVHLHCNRLLAGQRPSEGWLLQMLQRTRKGLSVGPARRAGGGS